MGLLSIAPMSGYDLALAADKSIAHFWPISKTQIYQELARLEDLGLVDGTRVSQDKLPDKRVFNLTQAGEEALDDWMEHTAPDPGTMRNPFLLRFFFGHRMSNERMRQLLSEERRKIEVKRDHLARVVELLADYPDAVFGRMAALYGVRHAEAHIKWVDEIEPELPRHPHRPDPRRKFAPTAGRLFEKAPARE